MKNNVYQIVTKRFIEQLEQGVIPWHKPWTGVRNKVLFGKLNTASSVTLK